MAGDMMAKGIGYSAQLVSKVTGGEYKDKVVKPRDYFEEVVQQIQLKLLETRESIKRKIEDAHRRVQSTREYQMFEIVTNLRQGLSETLELVIFGEF